jgi:CubicO group peptidase (beta-lactamase class C family)
VERQGGLPFGDWVQQQLLAPLGLKDTRPLLPAELLGTRLAQGWSAPDRQGRRQPVPVYEARAMTPSAGFSSSVEDLVRFGQWHLQAPVAAGVSPLTPAGRREMQRVQFQDPQDKRLRGLVWRLADEGGERVVMHDGLCPGQVSLLALVPQQGPGPGAGGECQPLGLDRRLPGPAGPPAAAARPQPLGQRSRRCASSPAATTNRPGPARPGCCPGASGC